MPDVFTEVFTQEPPWPQPGRYSIKYQIPPESIEIRRKYAVLRSCFYVRAQDCRLPDGTTGLAYLCVHAWTQPSEESEYKLESLPTWKTLAPKSVHEREALCKIQLAELGFFVKHVSFDGKQYIFWQRAVHALKPKGVEALKQRNQELMAQKKKSESVETLGHLTLRDSQVSNTWLDQPS